MSPLVVLVALKLPTAFAPPRVVPVVELVVSSPLVASDPVCVIAVPAVALIAPEVLLTAPFTAKLPAVAVRFTAPEPPAVTAAPIVSFVLAVRLMLPLAAVVIGPLVVIAPVLLTITSPVFCVIPVIPSVPIVLLRLMLPAPALVALKFVIAFVPAPLSV